MQVTVEYTAQLKQAAGVGSEVLKLPEPVTLQSLIDTIQNRHEGRLRPLLFDSQGRWQRSVLLFVDDQQVEWGQPLELADRQTVSLVSPISGG
jgi:molybdopterin converting factor small subunit